MTTAKRVKKQMESRWSVRQQSLSGWRAIASEHESLVYHDDAYNNGWSDGHLWEFRDGSILTEDGRGLVAIDERPEPYTPADPNNADWCDIHGFSGCED